MNNLLNPWSLFFIQRTTKQTPDSRRTGVCRSDPFFFLDNTMAGYFRTTESLQVLPNPETLYPAKVHKTVAVECIWRYRSKNVDESRISYNKLLLTNVNQRFYFVRNILQSTMNEETIFATRRWRFFLFLKWKWFSPPETRTDESQINRTILYQFKLRWWFTKWWWMAEGVEGMKPNGGWWPLTTCWCCGWGVGVGVEVGVGVWVDVGAISSSKVAASRLWIFRWCRCWSLRCLNLWLHMLHWNCGSTPHSYRKWRRTECFFE